MEQTTMLASVLGVFLVILGAAILLRWKQFIPVVEAYAQSGLVRMVYAVVELLAGLFLVVTHNEWSSLPAVIVTVLGWWAVIEGAVFLLLPDHIVAALLRAFNKPVWYWIGGAVQIVIGLYLTAHGFGLAS